MAAMTTEVGFFTMDGSVLSRLSPNSSPAHWKSYDDEASGSRPDPDTNTSHRRLKMFHSSSVTPMFIFGLSSFGPWMTTSVHGGPAMCVVASGPAANRAQVTDSLLSGVSLGSLGRGT